MSLRVWLPLNKDLRNQGLAGDVQDFSLNYFTQQTSGGKIGNNCYSGVGIYHLNDDTIIGNQWTLAAWIKASSWSQYNNIIICKNTTSANSQFYFSVINGTQLNIGINGSSTLTTYSYTFNIDTWYHVAATYDGTNYALYINGNSVKTGSCTNTLMTECNNLGIGCRSTNAAGTAQTGQANCYLQDVRIYDNALSAAEIHELSKGLVLHYPLNRRGFRQDNIPNTTDALYSEMGLDNNIEYDVSGYQHNGTDSGISYSSDTAHYNTSVSFDGTDDGIIIDNLDISNILNNQCTIAFWVKPSGENSERSVYFSAYTSTTWSIEKTAGNKLRSYWNGSPDTATTVSISDDVWQHIAITKNGTNDLKFYKDGQLIQSLTTSHPDRTFGTTWRLGRDTRSGDGTPYKGLMSDFRLYATALSADDISELYQHSNATS